MEAKDTVMKGSVLEDVITTSQDGGRPVWDITYICEVQAEVSFKAGQVQALSRDGIKEIIEELVKREQKVGMEKVVDFIENFGSGKLQTFMEENGLD